MPRRTKSDGAVQKKVLAALDISPDLQRWIDQVIVPALVREYLLSQRSKREPEDG